MRQKLGGNGFFIIGDDRALFGLADACQQLGLRRRHTVSLVTARIGHQLGGFCGNGGSGKLVDVGQYNGGQQLLRIFQFIFNTRNGFLVQKITHIFLHIAHRVGFLTLGVGLLQVAQHRLLAALQFAGAEPKLPNAFIFLYQGTDRRIHALAPQHRVGIEIAIARHQFVDRAAAADKRRRGLLCQLLHALA